MTIKNIASGQNALIKETKLLKNKKHREEKKMFFIEGERFVEQAISSNADVIRVFLSEQFFENNSAKRIISLISDKTNEIYLLPNKLFKEISDTENPQGILAVISYMDLLQSSISFGKDNVFVILDSIQDPGNMGTIVRTADAAGFSGIIISRGCVDIYNPKVLRSTMGSIFQIPIIFADDLSKVIHEMKGKGIKVFAAHLMANKDCFEINLDKNIAIVIGNEANGINDEIVALADELIKIPILGKAESLNASVACGVLLYESVRQRIKRVDV